MEGDGERKGCLGQCPRISCKPIREPPPNLPQRSPLTRPHPTLHQCHVSTHDLHTFPLIHTWPHIHSHTCLHTRIHAYSYTQLCTFMHALVLPHVHITTTVQSRPCLHTHTPKAGSESSSPFPGPLPSQQASPGQLGYSSESLRSTGVASTLCPSFLHSPPIAPGGLTLLGTGHRVAHLLLGEAGGGGFPAFLSPGRARVCGAEPPRKRPRDGRGVPIAGSRKELQVVEGPRSRLER